MPAIHGYTIKQVTGTKVVIGPGNAAAANGGNIANPNDIVLDVTADGPVTSDSMLAVYVVEDGGKVSGKASSDFSSVATTGKQRRIGAVRVTADGSLAEAFQTDSGQVRPTKYTDPGNDTKFDKPIQPTWGVIEFSKYIVPGGEVEIAITAAIPNAEVSVKGTDGVAKVVIGGGIIQVRTNNQGNGEFTSKDGPASFTVLSFQDVV
ncbi:MAG: hypothetical protein KC912_25345 [Proteobacteria bacterium]|nr:hypothetical protein [Pseudomonadota bacterium]